MALHVPVGPLVYELHLVQGLIDHDGDQVHGLCDPAQLRILISDQQSPERRVVTFWHELAHAWEFELDVRADEMSGFSGESLANLVALAMARIDADLLARCLLYLRTGIECLATLRPAGNIPLPLIIPVFHARWVDPDPASTTASLHASR